MKKYNVSLESDSDSIALAEFTTKEEAIKYASAVREGQQTSYFEDEKIVNWYNVNVWNGEDNVYCEPFSEDLKAKF